MKYLVLACSALIIGLDQFFKKLAILHLSEISTKPLIEDVFHLSYVENRGAAFGVLDGKTTFLSIFTLIVLVAIFLFIVYDRVKSKMLLWSFALILGGGIGNLIDRFTRGFVVDYLDLRVIRFAVFNFADCCIVVGTILIVIYLIFFENKVVKKTYADNMTGAIQEAIPVEIIDESNDDISDVNEKQARLTECEGTNKNEQ